MLFYPLWVLFWQFSCELVAPPLPVWVDEGWLKPRCGECVEHTASDGIMIIRSECVYLDVCTVVAMWAKELWAGLTCKNDLITIWEMFYRSFEQMVLHFASPSDKKPTRLPVIKKPHPLAFTLLYSHSPSPSPSPPYSFLYNFLLSVFLFSHLSFLFSPSLSFCFPHSLSCIDSALLCLRELASKLSAASGLKAISSASLPLQVRAWDW